MSNNRYYSLIGLLFLSSSLLVGCAQEPNVVTVTFENYDGTTLQETEYERDAEVVYEGAKPVHCDDLNYYYVFRGWDKEITNATNDITYVALFDSHPLENFPEDPYPYEEALPSDINDGAILHAFCWSYNDIKNQLPFIKDAGFKAVQIMPVQTPKSNGASWQMFYQPLSFTVAESSSLGTKAELEALCDEAENYDIGIVADIVFNHLANIDDDELEEDGTPKVSPDVAKYEPYIYEHRNDESNPTFHHNPQAEGSGKETQYYPYGKLPDLNTANEVVQERSLALLKECIDLGIDGFRFDAAKHIETPDDPNYASDFWPNTLGVAKQYYLEKTGKELFAYGEVLGTPSSRPTSVYTKLMNINDDSYGTVVNYAGLNVKAQNAVEASYKISDSTKLVGMLETHDTYTDPKTNPLSNAFLARSWAIISSRKDYHGLFLARPDQYATIGAIGDYFYRDETIGAVNRFHNRFIGAEEEQQADDSIYINERYSENDKGAIIVDYASSKKVVVDFNHLGTGVYCDQISGKKVTVRHGHATIELDSSGIAVLTRTQNGPYPSFDVSSRGGLFVDEKDIVVTYKNALEATYSINNGATTTFDSGKKIHIKASDAILGHVNLTITLKGYTKTVTESYDFEPTEIVRGYFNVLNFNPDYFDDYEVYVWSWNKTESRWSKDYTVQDNIVLFDDNFTSGINGLLFALFEKGYVIENTKVWDNNKITQSVNITKDNIEEGFYDARRF